MRLLVKRFLAHMLEKIFGTRLTQLTDFCTLFPKLGESRPSDCFGGIFLCFMKSVTEIKENGWTWATG